MSGKIIVGMMCLALVMAMAIPLAVASDENWVLSCSETRVYAFGKGDLEVNTITSSEIAVGDSVEEIIANTQSRTSASGPHLLILLSNSIIKTHTSGYEKTTTISSWTSSGLPTAFNGEQAVNNILDTHRNPRIESNLENIIYLDEEKYTFGSKAAFPLDGDQRNLPPLITITLDPRSSELNSLGINFGTGISNNMNAQGLEYTGSMDFKTELSVGGKSVGGN